MFLFTKMTSGYRYAIDSKPSDMLAPIKAHNLRVHDVPVTLAYDIGEISGMKIDKQELEIDTFVVANEIR